MKKAGIKMSFALGGTSSAICALQDKGLVDYILDTQDFDQGAAAHLFSNPHHIEIDLSEYANAGNKGTYVNKLDYVVLSALEIDTKFNVNVITGSDSVLRGAPGGHPDTAAGSKCCIIVTPLTRGRMATVCKDVVTVTTPGDCVDVLVTFVAHLDGSGATTFLIVVPAFLPIIGVVAPFGVSAQAVAATFLLTATFGTPVSPSVAAVYVGLGLADVTIGDHIKYSLKFVWPMSILTLIASTLLGVIPF